MIVQTEAFVMPVTIMQMGGKVVVPVARVFASDNDETGILYARAPKGKIFKILTQANIIRFVKTHEAECEKNGRFERIPVEIYSELAQMSANNRLYCFMKRQDLLLKNEEFCRVFCDKFRIPTASSDAIRFQRSKNVKTEPAFPDRRIRSSRRSRAIRLLILRR